MKLVMFSQDVKIIKRNVVYKKKKENGSII